MLFCGTLAFAVSLVDVFLSGLSTQQINRLIWAPEMVGCVLFLVSGHIGIIEVCHGRFRLLPSSLGWWIVIVNQIGSWLFFVSGLAAFVRPATGEVISVVADQLGDRAGCGLLQRGGARAAVRASRTARRRTGPTRQPPAQPAPGPATAL